MIIAETDTSLNAKIRNVYAKNLSVMPTKECRETFVTDGRRLEIKLQ